MGDVDVVDAVVAYPIVDVGVQALGVVIVDDNVIDDVFLA